MKKNKRALVVLPAYNEKEGVQSVIPGIFKVAEDIENWDIEVLVVDDNSPDGTGDAVKELQKQYKKKLHLIQGEKQGLGKAYVRGFTYALENIHPYVMFEMDADGQHNPELIPQFLKKIEDGCDFVIGSRYIKGGSIPSHWSWDRKFYSVIGNLVAQLGFMNFKARDWTSGYRCIKSWYLKDILNEMTGYNGYVFQIALLDKAFKKHLKIGEVPLKFTDRLDGESKFSSIQFITDALMYIFLQSSFVRFAITGLLGAVVDFGSAATLIGTTTLSKPTSNAISAELAIIFNFLVNNYWSFNHKKIEQNMFMKFIKFNLVTSGSVFIQWFGMRLSLSQFGDIVYQLPYNISLPSWIVYKVFIIALFVIPYSYIMYNLFIWKSPSQK